ncbi:MAG: class I SAM-dependent methyltransferase [Bacteroidetes bacterium]|nr:class I SAM-dependent methyltransferase [Bacteroidota bacterium]
MLPSALQRHSGTHIRSKDPHYIHYYFLMRDIKSAIDQYAQGKLLDIGCGNKPYKEWYALLTDDSIGCDMEQSDKNMVDILCPANKLAFEDEQFNTILCTQVLEHVFDTKGVLSEAYRVLKPGGHMLLTVPFTWEIHEKPYDFYRFTRYGLTDAFKTVGFEILELKANGGKWATIFQMFLNTIHSTFPYKTFRAKCLKILFMELHFTWLLNKIAIYLDKKYFDDWWALNYIIVAKK